MNNYTEPILENKSMGEIILTDLTVGSVVAVFVLGQSLKYIAAVMR